ncbi:MAG: RNA-binding protein [Desulfobacteraceae bacterium]
MNRLYVGNIPWATTEEQLEDVFKTYGKLKFVRIIRDQQGRSKGYAFVEFVDASAAQEAMEVENGTLLDGRTIRVNKAVVRDNNNDMHRCNGPNQNLSRLYRSANYKNDCYDDGRKRRRLYRRNDWQ